MGNVGSADEGVGETPGHGSSTVTPTSVEHSPHQEIVTASATVAEVQSGRVATLPHRNFLHFPKESYKKNLVTFGKISKFKFSIRTWRVKHSLFSSLRELMKD